MLSSPHLGKSTRPSPLGDSINFIRSATIFRLNAHNWRENPSASKCQLPTANSKITSLKWSKDGSQILAIHDTGILVMNSFMRAERVRLDNGTGGLGQISAADFIGNDHLLVVWEFGNAKLFNMSNGKSLELPDVKTTGSRRTWEVRPQCNNSAPPQLAVLSRNAAEDSLLLHIPETSQGFPGIKLSTIDAQSLSWSRKGTWLAILDAPTASPAVFIYTPDGHLFRSYTSVCENDDGLGVKNIVWSHDDRLVALASYGDTIEFLNTRTFSPIAKIEHSTVIEQRLLPTHDQVPVWQENVSASQTRSYSKRSQPISLPITRTDSEVEPKALGVAEMCFNLTGKILASRDCRMQSTIWLWNMTDFALHAVIVQHANVRCLQWHPTRPDLLLIDCAEGIVHILDVSSSSPPVALSTDMKARATLTWLANAAASKPAVLITEPLRFQILFPEGEDPASARQQTIPAQASTSHEGGENEDSLFDVLSGRKPLPPKTELSYTEAVDLAVEAEDSLNGPLDDTFREKRKSSRAEIEVDPLDDSEIF